jgi:hypothetical protein
MPTNNYQPFTNGTDHVGATKNVDRITRIVIFARMNQDEVIPKDTNVMNGLFLSTSAFCALSLPAQQEVLQVIGLALPIGSETVVAGLDASLANEDGEGPVELTVAMVRKLTDKLSDKTLNALKIIARSDTPQFHMKDVIEGTDGATTYMDMRGVWSALTRRTRNIMDDGTVDLIWWLGDEITDEAGTYVDHIGAISPLTHQSLRTHFGY